VSIGVGFGRRVGAIDRAHFVVIFSYHW